MKKFYLAEHHFILLMIPLKKNGKSMMYSINIKEVSSNMYFIFVLFSFVKRIKYIGYDLVQAS